MAVPRWSIFISVSLRPPEETGEGKVVHSVWAAEKDTKQEDSLASGHLYACCPGVDVECLLEPGHGVLVSYNTDALLPHPAADMNGHCIIPAQPALVHLSPPLPVRTALHLSRRPAPPRSAPSPAGAKPRSGEPRTLPPPNAFPSPLERVAGDWIHQLTREQPPLSPGPLASSELSGAPERNASGGRFSPWEVHTRSGANALLRSTHLPPSANMPRIERKRAS